MIATTFPEALTRIVTAATPADLFGADPADAKHVYRTLARLVHPDHVPAADATQAQTAFAKLARLYAANPKNATVSPVVSAPLPVVSISTKTRTYTTSERLAEGDLSSLILVRFTEDDDETTGILKIARDPANEDLLAAEAATLRVLGANLDPIYNAFIPELLDTLRYRDAMSGETRAANVLRDLPGFVPLSEVQTVFPAGLDARDLAWIWRRLLAALGAIHRAGVVHGAIIPEHILIEPTEHGLVLVDWCYAVSADGSGAFPPLAALVPARRALYPPEILAHEPASPASDVFMASKTMELLLDASAPRAIRAFVRGCIQERVVDRPDDAWSLLRELDGLLVRLWGPLRFRPFALPDRAPATS